MCKTRVEGIRARVCGECKRARYCSKACQTKHWREHKKECASLRLTPKAVINAEQVRCQEAQVALMHALAAGDRPGEGAAYCKLGHAFDSLGQFDKAIECHQKHLAIALEVGDRTGEGRAYGNLGIAF